MKRSHESIYADPEKKLAGTFTDLTQAQDLVLPRTYAKMREIYDLDENLEIGDMYADYAERLQQVTPAARELLLVLFEAVGGWRRAPFRASRCYGLY